jgi:hypothetical protein
LSGVNASPFKDVAVTTATGTNNARPNPPSITPVTLGAAVLAVGLGAGNNDVAALTSSDLVDFYSDGNNFTRFGAGLVKNWSAGAVDPVVWEGGTTTSTRSWASASIALRPA